MTHVWSHHYALYVVILCKIRKRSWSVVYTLKRWQKESTQRVETSGKTIVYFAVLIKQAHNNEMRLIYH